MQLYPAIDLKSGACVRLYQGAYDQVSHYHDDPIAVANNFRQAGAKWLHVIDLDGAKAGKHVQLTTINKIASLGDLNVQTGGGIRTAEDIKTLLDNGVARVILGSTAILNPETTRNFLEEFGIEKIVLALDVKVQSEPMLVTHAWQNEANKSLWELLDFYKTTVKHIICTDVGRDGTLQGPNMKLYQAIIARYPYLALQASGGINALSNLVALKAEKIAGAIVGKAFYENKFSITEALNEIALC